MVITVGMGEGAVAAAPRIIRAIGCGSCVALALYDGKRKVGGLAHIMLPGKAPIARGKALAGQDAYQYADTAVHALLEGMRRMGSSRGDIVAKVAGGASMFPSYSCAETGIGRQNVTSVIETLKRERIPVAGRDTGGSHGRNVEFHLDSGRVVVTAFEKADREM